VPDPTNPQALNRYSYCLNNPLKYTDPTGNIVSCGDDAALNSYWDTFRDACFDIAYAMEESDMVFYITWGDCIDPQTGIRFEGGTGRSTENQVNMVLDPYLNKTTNESWIGTFSHECGHAYMETFRGKNTIEDSKLEEALCDRLAAYVMAKRGYEPSYFQRRAIKVDLNNPDDLNWYLNMPMTSINN
jgi:hypothetical protein